MVFVPQRSNSQQGEGVDLESPHWRIQLAILRLQQLFQIFKVYVAARVSNFAYQAFRFAFGYIERRQMVTMVTRSMISFAGWLYFGFLTFLEILWEYFFHYITPNIPETAVSHRFQRYGVIINGNRPWDIHVLDYRFFIHMILRPELGLGEAYMYNWWTTEDMPLLFDTLNKFGYFDVDEHSRLGRKSFLLDLHTLTRRLSQGDTDVRRTKDSVLFEAFLDSTMSFSCGYWQNATTLEEAQRNKMELIARKLKLEPGMAVLDIGCGWGALAKYLAENYSVHVTGCTLFQNQAEFARKNCEGLPVRIHLTEYKNIREKFDRIVSVARFEYVQNDNYRTFFKFAANVLKEDGLFLLHTIGVNQPQVRRIDPWLRKYMFPDMEYPYHTDLAHSIDGIFVLEDWQNMGYHYSLTLEAWIKNFEQRKIKTRIGGKFYRMWQFFLNYQASMFRLRRLQTWQIVLSKNGFRGGYESVRLTG